jgi:hypothetical protein
MLTERLCLLSLTFPCSWHSVWMLTERLCLLSLTFPYSWHSVWKLTERLGLLSLTLPCSRQCLNANREAMFTKSDLPVQLTLWMLTGRLCWSVRTHASYLGSPLGKFRPWSSVYWDSVWVTWVFLIYSVPLPFSKNCGLIYSRRPFFPILTSTRVESE